MLKMTIRLFLRHYEEVFNFDTEIQGGYTYYIDLPNDLEIKATWPKLKITFERVEGGEK